MGVIKPSQQHQTEQQKHPPTTTSRRRKLVAIRTVTRGDSVNFNIIAPLCAWCLWSSHVGTKPPIPLCLWCFLCKVHFTSHFPPLDIIFSIFSLSQDCVQVPTDGLRSLDSGRKYGVYDGTNRGHRLNPPVNAEIKDGQWMGVEVQSQGEGGKVIVCAHRSVMKRCTAEMGKGLVWGWGVVLESFTLGEWWGGKTFLVKFFAIFIILSYTF